MKWILILIAINFIVYTYTVMKSREGKDRCDRCGFYRDVNTTEFQCVDNELVCEYCLRKMEL